MARSLTATSSASFFDDFSSLMFAPDIGGDLSDTEKRVTAWLAAKLMDVRSRGELQLSELYLEGLNSVPSLGISVPPELEPLRAILGWCSTAIEARSERLNVQGFRMPGEKTVNGTLQEIWQHNNLDAEAPLVHEQAMALGHTFAIAGPGDDGSGFPLITTESPLNMVASWDPKRRQISAAYQTYRDCDPTSDTYGRRLAALYTRNAIVQLLQGDNGWVVQDRNDHDQGFVPVVQFTPRPKFTDRLCGRSEMTPAWRNTQDRASRTLVRMEVSSEFFATAKLIFLGASEEAFQKADGSRVSAWETYIGRVLTLEADESGELPQVERIAGESPDGFISALNHERSIMCGHTGLAPQYLGIFSDGNPASADAIRMSDFRLKTIADRLCLSLGNEWERLMVYALKMSGEYTKAADQMETDWAYTGIPTPSADAIRVTEQVGAGMVPPDSDDALAECGWTPVQRERIAQARQRSQGLAVIQQQLAGLKPPAQATDGEQSQALQALSAKRSTDGASAG
ncbi:MAG: phage portal protein [Mycobacteriaceae bacterium]|nr:phage portal protein [Mycobacteriaceae bacterium]